MSERTRARVIVRGRVQGVFFRSETQKLAASLELDGWVRNVPDGTVEAAFEGDRRQVMRALQWCGAGPPSARVDSVETVWEDPVGESGFSVQF